VKVPGFDKSDVYEAIPIFSLIAWMVLFDQVSPFLPPTWRAPVKWVGFILPFMTMAGIELAYIYRTSPYPYVEMFISPRNQKLRFYIKKPIETREVKPGEYATKLNLAFPVKHPYYHVIESLVIHHEGLWDKRVKFQPGKAWYKEEVISHPQTTFLVVEEKAKGSFDIDHSSPVPAFRLVWAPGDYYLVKELLKPVNVDDPGSNPSGNPGGAVQVADLRFEDVELRKRVEELEHENAELRRQAYDWHQKYIRAEQVIDQLKNELMAVLKSKADFKASVIQYMLTFREQQLTIANALKKLQGPRIAFSKWLAITLIAIAGLIWLQYNPDVLAKIQSWLSVTTNQIFVLVALVIAFAIYISRRQ